MKAKEKNLAYWKNNAEEDYMSVPISVLRYIYKLEIEVDTIKDKTMGGLMSGELTNQRVIDELDSLKKGLIPKIRIKYQIGHYQSKDTQRFIEGVRSSVLEINNRIKELKQE